ncbi:AraC family transcriptional regulator ligand-binding domain-containing protein [Paraperlucidibaca wandonensis]|jgi:AraC-like DNA-binding protein|uniref:AraC family transcriptional regulator ligand-binding domain-containing protein n=1 Tax=Paraperlucidibaca wandonensis TaxID=1268273 RepID=A0ABW3HFJ5_9GAMM
MTIARHTAEATLSGQYLMQLLVALQALGLSSDAVLAGTPIQLESLNADQHLPWSQCLQLMRNAQSLAPSPMLAIDLGRLLNLRNHGFLGYAVLSSRTIGGAIDLSIRYFRTRTSLFSLRLFREGDDAVVQLDEAVPLGELQPFFIEALMTLMLVCGEQVTGRTFMGELRLSVSAAKHHSQWREVQGSRISYDNAFNQIRFPRKGLQMPLAQADPQLLAMATAQCEQELHRLRDHGGLLPSVKMWLREHLPSNPSLDQAAAAQAMSARTLRRRLSDLGTSYQLMMEQMRRGRAVELLLHSDSTVDAIAQALGYGDPSNFGRAFRRWTGVSPRLYREQSREQTREPR